MNKLNKILMVGIMVLTILVSACSNTPTGQVVQEQNTIKIGYASPLTGEAAAWGQPVKEGFEFALNEYNNKENKYKINVVYEDTQCDPTIGLSAINKLVDSDNVKIMTGTICSSVVMASAKKTESNNVLVISTGTSHPDVAKQGKNIFSIFPSDDYEGIAVANYMTQELNHKSVAVGYYNNNPAGIALKDAFKQQVLDNDGNIVSEEGFSFEEKDFRTTALKLTKDNPESIYIIPYVGQTPLLVNKLRELNYKGDIFVYSQAITEEEIQKIGSKENIYFAKPKEVKETNFWTNYKEEKGNEADLFRAVGYDSFKFVEKGIEVCGEDAECLKSYYLENEFQTTRGTLTFDEHGDVQGFEYEIQKLN